MSVHVSRSVRESVDAGGPDLAWLHAAKTGDWERLADLRDKESWDPLTAADRNGSHALHWAAGAGHLQCVRWLVDTCGVPASQACTSGRGDRRNALHWAARNGQVDVCRWLVHRGGLSVDSPTADGTTPFHWACWQGHFRCCRYDLYIAIISKQKKITLHKARLYYYDHCDHHHSLCVVIIVVTTTSTTLFYFLSRNSHLFVIVTTIASANPRHLTT